MLDLPFFGPQSEGTQSRVEGEVEGSTLNTLLGIFDSSRRNQACAYQEINPCGDPIGQHYYSLDLKVKTNGYEHRIGFVGNF